MKIVCLHRIGSRDGQAVHLEELIGALGEQIYEIAECGDNVVAFLRLMVASLMGKKARRVPQLAQ